MKPTRTKNKRQLEMTVRSVCSIGGSANLLGPQDSHMLRKELRLACVTNEYN